MTNELLKEKEKEINFWKNEYKNLKKSYDELNAKLMYGEAIGYPSEGKNPETNEAIGNLSKSSGNLEKTKAERDELKGKIFNKEAEKQKLKNEGKTDSEDYKRLLAEIEGLRGKLTTTNQDLEKMRRQVANLKEQLNASYQTLQEEIEKQKEQLREAKENCLKKMKEDPPWRYVLPGTVDYTEKLDRLLQSQKEITRNSSKLGVDEKNEIIEEIPEFSEELKVLCILQEQLTKLEMKKEDIEKAGHVLKMVMIAPIMPPHLVNLDNKEGKLRDNDDINKKNYDYNKVITEKTGGFFLQGNDETKELPFRLYNIETKQIEKTQGRKGKYAILSYVWGQSRKLTTEANDELNKIWDNSKLEYKNELTLLGYKTWCKAIKTCNHLGINYLWMDQLCINQTENTKEEQAEMEQEVSKMRQYYSNSAVTLIAIQTELGSEDKNPEEILKKVIRSDWFSRSWTFQEGWLSKHTIFMFDNCLIDGSLLANKWVLGQPSYTDGAKFSSLLEEGSQKTATPLGWTYYKEGYSEEDGVSFSLNQALRAIKNRGRYLPIDGIYSILGLLPYGDKVEVNYKKGKDGKCIREYTKEEMQKALFNVMKTALRHGRGEVLVWHGSVDKLGNDWLPDLYIEDAFRKRIAGGTNIEGGLSIIHRSLEEVNSKQSIEISSSWYKIKKVPVYSDIILKEVDSKGSVIDSGACTGRIKVENEDNEIALLTTERVLKDMQLGDLLLLLNKNEWRSNKPFALIVRKKENENFYQRIGLAEISEEGQENLQKVAGKEERLVIKMNDEQKQIQVAQVEQPTK
jgi:Heterokaryon incompatibility protein (HET)